jgi:hypothetical protein
VTREQLHQLDPTLKGIYRAIKWLVVALVVSVVFLAAAITGTFFRGESTRHITQNLVRNSVCAETPASLECQKTKASSDEAADLHTSCIQFRKVDRAGLLLRFTRCKGGDLLLPTGATTAAAALEPEVPPRRPTGETGNSAETGTKDAGQVTEAHGGSHPGGQSPGSEHTGPGAPTGSSAGPSADAPEPASPTSMTKPHPAPVGPGDILPSTVGAVGDTFPKAGEAVQGALDGAGHAVDGVGSAGCKLLGGGC